MRGTAVTDTFTRTVASGWGSANTGQAWTLGGAGGTVNATDASANGSAGLHSVPVASAYRITYLAGFSQPYVDLAVTGSVAVTPTGGPIELANLMTRATSITACYLFRTQIETGGAVTALIFSPAGTQLGSITVPGITYTAALQLRVRAQSAGRIHRMKVWAAANAEPAAWVLTVTDSTYTGTGFVGVRSGVPSTNTNAKPLVFTYDNVSSVLLPDFPADQLPLTVLAAFGANLSTDPTTWTWTNITGDVRAEGVTIRPGRPDETGQAPPAACNFQLNNGSKAYSAHNATSPNYPYVRRNTPIWVLVDPATRFFGYANGFTPSWDVTGRQAVVSVSASGILRRLTQGKTPLRSPLYRAITSSNPVAYWSLEDGADSNQAASGLIGGQPLTLTAGSVKFAAATGPAGSAPLADFSSGGTMQGAVPAGASTAQWRVEFVTKFNTFAPASFGAAMQWLTEGGVGLWEIDAARQVDGGLSLQYITAAGVFGGPFNSNVKVDDGNWHHIRVDASQSGGNISLTVKLDDVTVISQTLNSLTMGRVTTAIINPTGDTVEEVPTLGHLAVWAPFSSTVDTVAASRGYAGDTPTARLARLCAEEGVPITITGTSTTAMGPQAIATFVSLLRECEAADLGLLYDGFVPGLGYITRSARYNQPAALTLDVAAGQVDAPFAPADDDQRNRNLYKVDRRNGSSATYEDKTGPLGTDPQKGIGTYDSSATVNVATDDVLLDYASWLVHLGTVEGFRYPSLNLDLAAVPSLIDDWVAARLNSRIDVLNVDGTATGHAPGTVSLQDEGYTETLTPFGWKVTANCSPFGPWQVFVLDTDRLDADPSSQLVSGISTSVTTFQVSTAAVAGALWTTDPAEWTAPKALYLNVDGEQMRVTNITGTTSPQTFTVVRSVNGVVKTHAAGAYVGLWQPRVLAL